MEYTSSNAAKTYHKKVSFCLCLSRISHFYADLHSIPYVSIRLVDTANTSHPESFCNCGMDTLSSGMVLSQWQCSNQELSCGYTLKYPQDLLRKLDTLFQERKTATATTTTNPMILLVERGFGNNRAARASLSYSTKQQHEITIILYLFFFFKTVHTNPVLLYSVLVRVHY